MSEVAELRMLRAAFTEAETILWKISGRSSADGIMKDFGLEISPSQILARTWLEKYSTRIGYQGEWHDR